MKRGELYEGLVKSAAALVGGETDAISNTANIAALVYNTLNSEAHEGRSSAVNWVGFYFTRKQNVLKLGPFHGKPACLTIPFSKGVCGAAARTKTTQVVKDVHTFEGHIACDSDSNSEIVIPIIDKHTQQLVGVFDLDSPHIGFFGEEDKKGLEQIVKLLVDECVWDFVYAGTQAETHVASGGERAEQHTDPHLSKEVPIQLPPIENISKLRVGLIRTSWNETLVSSLASKAKHALEEYGVKSENIVKDFKVPGSFELPIAAQKLAQSKLVDVIICFGVLIKGETMHFEYISSATSQGLMQVQLSTGVPVIYGVLNCLTLEQAAVRCGVSEHSILPQSLAATAIQMGSLTL